MKKSFEKRIEGKPSAVYWASAARADWIDNDDSALCHMRGGIYRPSVVEKNYLFARMQQQAEINHAHRK